MPDGDASERYDVELTGEVLPGRDPEAVVRAIAELYHADRKHVRRLMAAAPRVCKRNLSLARAERHVKVLRRAGAVAVAKPRSDTAPAPSQAPVIGESMIADSVIADSVIGHSVLAHSGIPASSAARPPGGSGLQSTPAASHLAEEGAIVDEPVGAGTDARDLDADDAPSSVPPPVDALDPGDEPARRGAWRSASLGLTAGLVLGILVGWWAAHSLGPVPFGGPGVAAPAATSDAPPALADAAPRPALERLPEPAEAAAPATVAADDREASGEGGDASATYEAAATVTTPEPVAVSVPASAPDDAGAPEVAVAGDGPFGLDQGMPIAALDLSDDVSDDGREPGHQRLAAVPRPLPGIDRVVAIAADGTGICGIDARTHTIETGADGTALRDAFAEMEAALDRRYDARHRTNIRLSRASGASDLSWMQQLQSGERRLTSVWAGSVEAPLADELQRITLTASAEAEDRGLIRIAYRFGNYAECMAELSEAPGDH